MSRWRTYGLFDIRNTLDIVILFDISGVVSKNLDLIKGQVCEALQQLKANFVSPVSVAVVCHTPSSSRQDQEAKDDRGISLFDFSEDIVDVIRFINEIENVQDLNLNEEEEEGKECSSAYDKNVLDDILYSRSIHWKNQFPRVLIVISDSYPSGGENKDKDGSSSGVSVVPDWRKQADSLSEERISIYGLHLGDCVDDCPGYDFLQRLCYRRRGQFVHLSSIRLLSEVIQGLCYREDKALKGYEFYLQEQEPTKYANMELKQIFKRFNRPLDIDSSFEFDSDISTDSSSSDYSYSQEDDIEKEGYKKVWNQFVVDLVRKNNNFTPKGTKMSKSNDKERERKKENNDTRNRNKAALIGSSSSRPSSDSSAENNEEMNNNIIMKKKKKKKKKSIFDSTDTDDSDDNDWNENIGKQNLGLRSKPKIRQTFIDNYYAPCSSTSIFNTSASTSTQNCSKSNNSSSSSSRYDRLFTIHDFDFGYSDDDDDEDYSSGDDENEKPIGRGMKRKSCILDEEEEEDEKEKKNKIKKRRSILECESSSDKESRDNDDVDVSIPSLSKSDEEEERMDDKNANIQHDKEEAEEERMEDENVDDNSDNSNNDSDSEENEEEDRNTLYSVNVVESGRDEEEEEVEMEDENVDDNNDNDIILSNNNDSEENEEEEDRNPTLYSINVIQSDRSGSYGEDESNSNHIMDLKFAKKKQNALSLVAQCPQCRPYREKVADPALKYASFDWSPWLLVAKPHSNNNNINNNNDNKSTKANRQSWQTKTTDQAEVYSLFRRHTPLTATSTSRNDDKNTAKKIKNCKLIFELAVKNSISSSRKKVVSNYLSQVIDSNNSKTSKRKGKKNTVLNTPWFSGIFSNQSSLIKQATGQKCKLFIRWASVTPKWIQKKCDINKDYNYDWKNHLQTGEPLRVSFC